MKYFHRFLHCLLWKTSFQQGINGRGNKLVKLQVGYLIAFNAWATLQHIPRAWYLLYCNHFFLSFCHCPILYVYFFFFASAFLKFLVHYPYNSLMISFRCLSLRLVFREQGSQPSSRIFVAPGSCRDPQIRITLISSPCLLTGNTKEKT